MAEADGITWYILVLLAHFQVRKLYQIMINYDRLLSSVMISAFTDFEATHDRAIGTGSSPISNQGFAHPSARLGRSKTK